MLPSPANLVRWKISDDFKILVFPIIVTNKRPDLVIWKKEDKKAMLLELTIPWEENFEQAEE